jgi:hypothetical protein
MFSSHRQCSNGNAIAVRLCEQILLFERIHDPLDRAEFAAAVLPLRLSLASALLRDSCIHHILSNLSFEIYGINLIFLHLIIVFD